MRSAHLELMKLVMNKKLKDLKVFPEVRSMYIHSVTFCLDNTSLFLNSHWLRAFWFQSNRFALKQLLQLRDKKNNSICIASPSTLNIYKQTNTPTCSIHLLNYTSPLQCTYKFITNEKMLKFPFKIFLLCSLQSSCTNSSE